MGQPKPYHPLCEFVHHEPCGCVCVWNAPHRRVYVARFIPCATHQFGEARGWRNKVEGRGWKALEAARKEYTE